MISSLSSSSSHRHLQTTTPPTTTYAARRINAGGVSEYIDGHGISWGADDWYGNKGRRTTPSECTADIRNTTDDILYCSNRFYPTSIVDPPYRYNIPVPYAGRYDIRLHFAEVVRRETERISFVDDAFEFKKNLWFDLLITLNFSYTSLQSFQTVGKRVFHILVDGTVAVKNLDVYARAGFATAYVLAVQEYVTDRVVTIQFVPVVDDPFISAIEVFEMVVPNATTAPNTNVTIPTASPIVVPSASPRNATSTTAVVRLNAGGAALVDRQGNLWDGDAFFQGNYSLVGEQACDRNITNTVDDALFCTERYFKGPNNSTLPSGYEIPVNNIAVYLVRLYFSENVSKNYCQMPCVPLLLP